MSFPHSRSRPIRGNTFYHVCPWRQCRCRFKSGVSHSNAVEPRGHFPHGRMAASCRIDWYAICRGAAGSIDSLGTRSSAMASRGDVFAVRVICSRWWADGSTDAAWRRARMDSYPYMSPQWRCAKDRLVLQADNWPAMIQYLAIARCLVQRRGLHEPYRTGNAIVRYVGQREPRTASRGNYLHPATRPKAVVDVFLPRPPVRVPAAEADTEMPGRTPSPRTDHHGTYCRLSVPRLFCR